MHIVKGHKLQGRIIGMLHVLVELIILIHLV